MTYPQFKGVLKGVERKLEIKFALQGVELSKSAEKAGNIHVVNGNDFDDIQDVLSHF